MAQLRFEILLNKYLELLLTCQVYLTTTWIKIYLWLSNQVQKINFMPQVIPEILLTHFFESLSAGPGMPDNTYLQWLNTFVTTSMDA